TVMTYNTKVQSVPTNIVAKLHNFTERDMLSIPEVERVAPKVEF
ncbi:LemA family protein, partial [Listeria monocytogenes]